MTREAGGLLAATVRLVRALRRRGVAASPADSLAAGRALDAVDVGDRHEVYLALRTVFMNAVDDRAAFDDAFAAVWRGESPLPDGSVPARTAGDDGSAAGDAAEHGPPAAAVSPERWLRPDESDGGAERVGVPTVSPREVLAQKDFREFGGADDIERFTRVARRIARRVERQPGRRWQPTRRGPRVDPRRTLRRALRTGGEAVELAYRRRKPKRTKLAALCDVSGSMDVYSRFLLRFLYALQNGFERVDTFVFGTRLSRITPQLRGRSWEHALERLSTDVRDWSGGTRIGECLAAFAERWERRVDRRTVVVVLSDGWDTGEPAVLERALRTIRRRARRIVWLNPLLGNPDYRPLTRGMQAALPHVDVFAPAHNLEALERLRTHLRV